MSCVILIHKLFKCVKTAPKLNSCIQSAPNGPILLLHICNWNPTSLPPFVNSFYILSLSCVDSVTLKKSLRDSYARWRVRGGRPAVAGDHSCDRTSTRISGCPTVGDGSAIAGQRATSAGLLWASPSLPHVLSFNLFICMTQDREEPTKTTRQCESLSARHTICSSDAVVAQRWKAVQLIIRDILSPILKHKNYSVYELKWSRKAWRLGSKQQPSRGQEPCGQVRHCERQKGRRFEAVNVIQKKEGWKIN
jgi:hypothetical protein